MARGRHRPTQGSHQVRLKIVKRLERKGTLEERDNGSVHEVKAGTLYAMNDHDRHRARAKTRMHVVRTFLPAVKRRMRTGRFERPLIFASSIPS